MIKRLKLTDIVTDAGTQVRAGLNEATVADYAEALAEGAKFPPVVVFHDGSHYIAADGFHRIQAAIRMGATQIECDMLFGEVNFSSALSQLDQAWTDIKTAKPFAVCPTCQGQLPENCTLCRGRGLISEHRWNTCVTREDKEFRARARGKH